MGQAEYAKNFIVGKGTYLVAYHNEGYTNINEAYLRLLRYASSLNRTKKWWLNWGNR